MRTDEKIKKDIIDRFSSDSRIDASNIKVKVDNSIATLTGEVLTFSDKLTAADIARQVIGVVTVGNELDVEFDEAFTVPSDKDIQETIENLIKWNAEVDEDKVTVKVSAGVVTLEGSVPTLWDKVEAELEAGKAAGVIDVVNKIAVVPTEKVTDEVLGERIMDRVEQSAPLAVDEITAKVKDGKVNLDGEVGSFSEWRSVYNAAQNTIGVVDVEDDIDISYT